MMKPNNSLRADYQRYLTHCKVFHSRSSAPLCRESSVGMALEAYLSVFSTQ